MDPEDATSMLVRNLGFPFPSPHIRGDRIVQQLKAEDPSLVLQALENLSSTLLMSREEGLLTFPASQVVPELVHILEANTPYAEIPFVAARIITQLIDRGVPHILDLLVESGVLKALNMRFQDVAFIDIVEQAIVILERLAQEFPTEVLNSGCPVLCLQSIDFFNMHIQRSILTVIAICCSAISVENLETVRIMVPILKDHLQATNPALLELSISGICVMVQAVSRKIPNARTEIRNLFSDGGVTAILVSRLKTDDPLLTKSLKALCTLVENTPHLIPELIKSNVPAAIAVAFTKTNIMATFNTNEVVSILLHCPKETQMAAMTLFCSMLPQPNLGFPFKSPYEKEDTIDKLIYTDLSSESIESFAIVASQLATLVHSCCADSLVRQQALQAVLQIAALPNKTLRKVGQKVDLISFVSLVVSQSDNLSLIIGGLLVCHELIVKAPDCFAPEFARQGLAAELEAIVASNHDTAVNEVAWTADSKGLPNVASHVSMRILEKLQAFMPETKTINSECLDALASGDTSAWPQVAELIQHMSMFELLRADAFKLIADQILKDPAAFISSCTNEQFGQLVLKLQEALSRTERCNVLSSTGGQLSTLVGALHKHIRIRIEDANHQTSWAINVQAIASIKNLEEFCQNRLAFYEFMGNDDNLFSALAGRHRHTQYGGNGHDDDDGDEQEEDDDDEDDEEDGSGHGHVHEHEHDDNTDSDQMPEFEDASNYIYDAHLDRDLDDGMEDDEDDEEDDENADHRIEGHSMDFDELEEEISDQDGLVELPQENVNEDSDEAEELEASPENTSGEAAVAAGAPSIRAPNRPSVANLLHRDRPMLKFYYQGKPLHSDQSVLGAILDTKNIADDNVLPRSLWADEFQITFERTDKPVVGSATLMADSVDSLRETPASLGSNPQLRGVLRLLSILNILNEKHEIIRQTDFVNLKLTSKLNRQLEDPLIVIANILPQWVIDTVRIYPFLYPFASRYLFLKSTSFGYSRSISRWQNRNDEQNIATPTMSVGRIVKQKYRISRKGMLANALKVLGMTRNMAAMIEIEYYGEQGTGLGPTLEFYASVSREFLKKSTKMWRGEIVNGYFYDEQGVFPSPFVKGKQVLALFIGLGRFFARALLDERMLDLRINHAFFILVLGHQDFYDPKELLRLVDPVFADQLFALDPNTVESLELDFTLPSYDDLELLPGGKDQLVTGDRLQEYIDLVIDWSIGRGIAPQIDAFIEGFSECMPIEALTAFLPKDFYSICGQNNEEWDEATLAATLHADHGYTIDSKPVRQLMSLMSRFDAQQRRRFLQFMTGSPNLPIGGFKMLNPAFTVVLKHGEDPNLPIDQYYPSVMTCANYLKLPEYSNETIMSERLWGAIEGGSGVFPLS